MEMYIHMISRSYSTETKKNKKKKKKSSLSDVEKDTKADGCNKRDILFWSHFKI